MRVEEVDGGDELGHLSSLPGMADLNRLRVLWSGSPVTGDGISTLYCTGSPDGFPASVYDFFNTLKLMFPIGLTITVPNFGDKINDATGELSGSWSTSDAAGPVVCTGSSSWAAGVGARIRWHTDGIVGGRRVVGSTFLCPIVTPGYDTSGTLENVNRAAIDTEANEIVTEVTGLCIWSPPVPGRPGTHSDVTKASVPDKVSWLRSRRT